MAELMKEKAVRSWQMEWIDALQNTETLLANDNDGRSTRLTKSSMFMQALGSTLYVCRLSAVYCVALRNW